MYACLRAHKENLPPVVGCVAAVAAVAVAAAEVAAAVAAGAAAVSCTMPYVSPSKIISG